MMRSTIGACAVMVLGGLAAAPARADQYEASLRVRPLGALARIPEHVGGPGGAPVVATARGAGAGVELTYGVRNWLDVGGELIAVAFAPARYDTATVAVLGSPRTGRVVRTTRLAQLRAGATLRTGVAWIATVHLGVGVGARLRVGASLVADAGGAALGLTPDGMAAAAGVDIAATLRLGLERRLGPRWTIGIAAGATEAIGLGAPSLALLDAGLTVNYLWYTAW